MRFAVLLLIAFLAAPLLSAQRVVPTGGQWLIEPGERSGIVRLTIRYGERRSWDNWNSQDDVPLSQLVGLSAADMRGSGVTVHFKIVRSAGTLDCEGWFDDGKGSGHFTYQPNPDFVAELAKRGVTGPPPTAWEQFQMTVADVGLELVDELARQKYERPTAAELARMATHGVDLEYVRDIGARGYHLSDSKSLVRMRDHGVNPEFIESLNNAGHKNLGADGGGCSQPRAITPASTAAPAWIRRFIVASCDGVPSSESWRLGRSYSSPRSRSRITSSSDGLPYPRAFTRWMNPLVTPWSRARRSSCRDSRSKPASFSATM